MNEELITRAVAYEMRRIFDKYGALTCGPEHAFYHTSRAFDSLEAALKNKDATSAEQIDRLLHMAATTALTAWSLSPGCEKGFAVCYLNRAESPNVVTLRDEFDAVIVYPLRWVAEMVAEEMRLDSSVAGLDVAAWVGGIPVNPFHTIPNEIAMFEDGEVPFEEDDNPFHGACDHVIDALEGAMATLRAALRQVELGGSAYDAVPAAQDVLAAWQDLTGLS